MKKVLLFLASLMMLTLLCSCGGADDAEIIASLSASAPKAYELYTIIYGDVLPREDVSEDGYYKVTSDSPYKTLKELDFAMREVFYYDYYVILANTAFRGVVSDEGEIGAKFAELDGELYVAPSVTAHFAVPREFDLTKAKVIKKNKYMATVRIPHADGDIDVTLQNVGGEWKINSPLY